MRRLGSRASRADPPAGPALEILIHETLTALVHPPAVRTGDERNAGDFVPAGGTATQPAVPVARLLFFTGPQSFDLRRVAADVSWGSEAGRIWPRLPDDHRLGRRPAGHVRPP